MIESPYKYRVTQLNYSSKQFNLAKTYCDKLVKAMYENDSLIMIITGILGSDLIKGALDQKFVLVKMKELTSKRAAILSCIGNGDQVKNVRDLVDDLLTFVSSVEIELNEWMARQSSEVASIERSKHRYIKLEKWNTVI